MAINKYQIRVKKHILDFRFSAGTSRGFLETKTSWFIIVDDNEIQAFGVGECGPLKGLSIDDRPDFETVLLKICKKIEYQLNFNDQISIEDALREIPLFLPSVKMGMETALLDLINDGRREIFSNDFFKGEIAIPINGLIWMGDMEFMIKQAEEKIDMGFKCIKLKIGALDFQKEIDIIKSIRSKYAPEKIEIRVDANGAFSPEEALAKIDTLAQLGIHSIEQPIMAGQPAKMFSLCRESPVPVALDEDLIGIGGFENKHALLHKIRPQYIVLKPTLVGGFMETVEWIKLADEMKIGWWITSALESNIGLNAICQFTADYHNPMYHGLGTGQLYRNNIPSPIQVQDGMIRYQKELDWDLKPILADLKGLA